MKKILSSIAAMALGFAALAQPTTDVIMNAANNNATFNTCLGGLYDSGGTGANAPYGNNESYVVTVCPDNPTDFITLQWTVFNLDCTDNLPGPPTDADNITIYDGPNTASPTLGTYYCNDLTPGDIFGATPANPTGCLTIEFNSNANGTGDFNAQISCETPCDPATAVGEIVGGPAIDSIAVCVGDLVTFQDGGSTPGPSGLFTLEQWVWQWMDGTPNDTLTTPGQVQHAWDTPGQYVVQLVVIDDNDCVNLNATDIQVFVTTYPTFDPFPLDTTLCIGETLDLDAFPDQYETTWSGFPLQTWIDDNCMEDLTGIVQSTPMTITGYDPNISLNAANPDIFSICVDIEHSFIGDFVLQVQCPTGQIMTLHQQGGGGTNLGDPEQGIIDCNDPATFGTPWNYCFTPTAPNTWVDAVNLGLQIPNGTGGNSLPPGDYAPIDPFSALDGCPINGTWQLLFTDLWGADDGSMPGWSINFDPALNPPVTVFTPQIGLGNDSSWWDVGPFITNTSADGNSITIEPTSPGTYGYTFNVINSFGCQFDSTVFITVDSIPPVDAGLDTAICDGLIGVPIGPTNLSVGCDYTLDLVDTFGDGWNGNTITITVNGVPTNYTINAGTGATFTIPVTHGDQIDLQWNATGNWQSECEIYFYDANGTLIHSDGTGFAVPSTNVFTFTADCLGGMVYTWTPGGTLTDPNIPNPTANPVTTTTYTLTAYPAGHPDCAVTDDVTVSIGGGLDAGTDSTALLCFEGAAVDLFNWLGGTPQTTNSSWLDPAGNPVVMPITPATAAPGMYEYVVDSAGCSVSAFIDVQIFQVTGATVVTNSDCQACNGQIVVTGANGIGPYTYSIDAGANFQASDTFTGLCGAATPGVQYDFIIQDSLGCQANVSDLVEDINIPTLNPTVFTDATCFGVCDGTIDVSGTNLVNYSIDNGTNLQAAGNFTALCPGTYDIYADNGFGCSVTDQVTIVEPPVLSITSISPDVQVCPGETVTATVAGQNGIGNVQFTWEDGLGNALGTGSPIDITSTGTMVVCVTMSDDCPTTDQACFNITEPAPVFPMMTSDVTDGCAPLTVTFSNLSNGTLAQTVWTFSDGTTIIANGNSDVSHMFTNPGTYDVSMEITTTAGCVYDTTFYGYVTAHSLPTANFTHSPIPATIYDTEVDFTDFSSDDVTTWMWDFGPNGLPGGSSVQNPTVLYPEGEPGNYPVTLTVMNDFGCMDSITGLVQVINDVVIYAPNIFTPDGDEYNENWRVYITGIDIYDFHLIMYNRWGEIVWESYNPEGVWNGHYGGGGLVQDGTYVWVIQTKDSYTDKKYEFRGHVTVLK